MPDAIEAHFIQQINQNLAIVHKVCRIYFTDPDDRKDLMQEMMYQLWRSYPHFGGRSLFSTWMYRVCLNTALTYRRNRRKERTESLSLAHQEVAVDKSESREEEVSMLFKAIAKLTALNKAIVLLYLENLSYDEIAEITGLTRSNVSVRLVRIKKELEILLKK